MHNLDKPWLICQDCKGNLCVFSLLTKSSLVIYPALGVVRKQQVDQAIAHRGHHNCEDHINVKNAITAFRNLHSIVASVRFCLVVNVEKIDYEKPYIFDEVANKHDRNQTSKKISREITFCRLLCYPHIFRVHSYAFVRTHSSVEMDAPEILGVLSTSTGATEREIVRLANLHNTSMIWHPLYTTSCLCILAYDCLLCISYLVFFGFDQISWIDQLALANN